MAEKQNWWEKWKEVVTISVIALGLGIFYVAVLFSDINMSSDGIVLGFFGILTTFVVIGNYAQVVNIKSEMKQEIDKINDDTKTNSLSYKINELYGKNGRPKYEDDIDNKVAAAIERLAKDHNQELSTIFTFILRNQLHDFMSKILGGGEVKCKVITEQGGNEKTAKAKIEGDKIIFRDSVHREIIERILTLDGKMYDSMALNRIVQWWIKNNIPNIPKEDQESIFGQRK